MKLLHVITGLQKAAGTSVFCVELCNHLALQGEDCYIVVRQKSESDCLPHSSVPVLEVEGNPSALPFEPDIVHIHALWDPFLHRFATWARKNHIPLAISPHGMLTPWALKQKRLKKGLALALYQYRDLQSAALLHATAASEVEDIRRLRLKPPVVIAPLGVDMPSEPSLIRNNSPKIALFVSRIHPKKGLLNLIEAWAQVKSSKVRECESALVERPKARGQRAEDGKDNSAFGLQPSTFPPWQLVIAGPDQAGHKAELVAEAERLGLSVADVTTNELLNDRTHALLPDIIFAGPVFGAEKDALYRLADLFVLPTYSENFGVVVIEALEHGCPVITTKGAPWSELLGNEENVNGKPLTVNSGQLPKDCREYENVNGKPLKVRGKPFSDAQYGGNQSYTANDSRLTEYTANGRCGWWIDIGVEPLTEALREAMSLSDEERHAMGENGQKLVEAKYTWPAIAEQMKAAYAWILNGGQPPPCVRVS